jgi:hypothetical protein
LFSKNQSGPQFPIVKLRLPLLASENKIKTSRESKSVAELDFISATVFTGLKVEIQAAWPLSTALGQELARIDRILLPHDCTSATASI